MFIQLADYLISAVHYSHSESCIKQVYVHENQAGEVGECFSTSPQWVVYMIGLGYVFSTITEKDEGGWEWGDSVVVDNVLGVDCIKTVSREERRQNLKTLSERWH